MLYRNCEAISYKVKKQAGGLRERVDIILYRHEMVYVTILETVIKYISEQMHDWSNILLIKYFMFKYIYVQIHEFSMQLFLRKELL